MRTEMRDTMFVWSKHLYMDEKVSKNPKRYKRLIKRKKIIRSCYVITLPVNDSNLMDIYSSREFWFQYQRTLGLHVIGMACCKESAFQMAADIVQDVCYEKGEINPAILKQYFYEK